MPYIISPKITLGSEGEWHEGSAYERESLYCIKEGKLPPVNYDKHILKPHSLTHIETPLHVEKDANGVDHYFKDGGTIFFGKAHVVKFENTGWKQLDEGLQHKVISIDELMNKISKLECVERILISVDGIDENQHGYHDPKKIVTLSLKAAEYLTALPNFKLFGTSWKSTDFMPGSAERPIHKEIFKKALILEYVNLNNVPEGEYFINCFPLNLEGASESPVTAVLFEKGELEW
jgi:arylformamidase